MLRPEAMHGTAPEQECPPSVFISVPIREIRGFSLLIPNWRASPSVSSEFSVVSVLPAPNVAQRPLVYPLKANFNMNVGYETVLIIIGNYESDMRYFDFVSLPHS